VNQINLDFFQLIIIFGSAQGLIFCLTISFRKKYWSRSILYITLTVLLISLTNLHHIIVVNFDHIPIISIIRKLYIPWQWLTSPLLFLYVHSIYGKKKPLNVFKWILVLGPFLLVALIHFGQYMYQIHWDNTYVITRYYERGLFLYTNLASFFYGPVNIYMINETIKDHEAKNPKAAVKIAYETTWIKGLINFGSILITLGFITATVIIATNFKNSVAAYPFLVTASIWVYWIGYVGLNKSINLRKRMEQHLNAKLSDNGNSDEKTGYKTFFMINEFVKKEKAYRDIELTLLSLANKFMLSQGYLSQLINSHSNKNFNEYINEFRVEEAKGKLTDPAYDYYTIESIGLECGFKSKSNFYTSFKKFTGLTPNQYKKSQQ